MSSTRMSSLAFPLAKVSQDDAKMRERGETSASRGLSPFSHFYLVVRELC